MYSFNKIILVWLAIVAVVCVGSPASARPVSYPGGWTVMTMNDYDSNSLHVHYSPTAKYSIGYQTAYWREGDYQTHSLKVNNLIKRWNNLESQGNLYLKSGLGLAHDVKDEDADGALFHGFTGMAADWEDRRWFAQYANHLHHVEGIATEYSQKMRFGVTPYIGEYGDLHTWIMLRIDHNPEDEDNIVLVPHVRFFKGEYMLELGWSDNDEILANLIIRF